MTADLGLFLTLGLAVIGWLVIALALGGVIERRRGWGFEAPAASRVNDARETARTDWPRIGETTRRSIPSNRTHPRRAELQAVIQISERRRG